VHAAKSHSDWLTALPARLGSGLGCPNHEMEYFTYNYTPKIYYYLTSLTNLTNQKVRIGLVNYVSDSEVRLVAKA
jgi:hypothetical protein